MSVFLAVVALAAIAFLALAWIARRAWRRSVRQELVSVLREIGQGLEVTAEHEGSLEIRMPDGTTGTAFLHNFYAGMSEGPTEEKERREAIVAFARGLVSQQEDASAPLTLEKHGERLLPRLVDASLPAGSAPDDPLVHREVGIPGLAVAYVLDSEHSVMYLTRSRLAELGIDAAALHERTLANLRRTFPAAVVRDAVDNGRIQMVKAGDSFDATRLLLVPAVLEEGEALAAVIPDRETLGLLPVPVDGNWRALDRVARAAASPYRLLDKPLKVTRAGFEVMGG